MEKQFHVLHLECRIQIDPRYFILFLQQVRDHTKKKVPCFLCHSPDFKCTTKLIGSSQLLSCLGRFQARGSVNFIHQV